MLLEAGESVCFSQPRLDWVLAFVHENHLTDTVSVVVE